MRKVSTRWKKAIKGDRAAFDVSGGDADGRNCGVVRESLESVKRRNARVKSSKPVRAKTCDREAHKPAIDPDQTPRAGFARGGHLPFQSYTSIDQMKTTAYLSMGTAWANSLS
ncbi:hypothetical protein PILCRDRAFT_84465 [Piloderma croceum F 1598]|uniref:Uncharacterized protein n=1 Tax=Piloderma croceum (strain F 1598) TaxID=765440 RepID=A0A0C3G274_PILCF|nr:hypothetical protein PILCRDRAFT_84465 [Piloderma croceum F 1598]